MKNIKFLKLFFIFTLVFYLTSCQNSNTDNSQKNAEIALNVALGEVADNSYNQSALNAIEKFAKENNKTYAYYKAKEKTDASVIESIDRAVASGAKVVVTPGVLFSQPVYVAQEKYPDVKFIITDSVPTNPMDKSTKITPNTIAKLFAEYEAGYIAGYAIVKDGFKNLGFMGSFDVDAIKRFGFGFVQGADDAAKELKLEKNSINVKYHYIGSFEKSLETEELAAAWYKSGVDTIFACAGDAGTSVMRVAEKYNKYVIGVDIDQSFQSDSVVTSAKKNVEKVVYDTLIDIYSNKFEGGKQELLTIESGDISLEMKNTKLKNFKQADFDKLIQKISTGELKIDKFSTLEPVSKFDKKCEYVNIEYIR